MALLKNPSIDDWRKQIINLGKERKREKKQKNINKNESEKEGRDFSTQYLCSGEGGESHKIPL